MTKSSEREGDGHTSSPLPERKVSSRALEKLRRHIESVHRAQPGDGKKLAQCYDASFIRDNEIVERCAQKSGRRRAIEGLTESIDLDGTYFEELLADPQVVCLMALDPDGHEKVPLGLLAMRFPQPGEDGAKNFRESLVEKFRKMGMSSLLGGERHFLHTPFMDDLYSASHFSVFEIASKDKLVTSALIYRTVQEAGRASEEQGRKFASLSCHCLQGVMIDKETYNLAGNPPVNQLNWKNWMDVIFEIGADRQLHVPNALLREKLPQYYDASASDKKEIAVPSRLIFGVWYGTVEAIAKRVSLLGEVEPVTDDAIPRRLPQWREKRRKLVLGTLATVCTGVGLALWKLLTSDIPDKEAIPEQDATESILKQDAPERAILRPPRVTIDLEDGQINAIYVGERKIEPLVQITRKEEKKNIKHGYIVHPQKWKNPGFIVSRDNLVIGFLHDAHDKPLFCILREGSTTTDTEYEKFLETIANNADLMMLLESPLSAPDPKKYIADHVRSLPERERSGWLDYYERMMGQQDRFSKSILRDIENLIKE